MNPSPTAFLISPRLCEKLPILGISILAITIAMAVGAKVLSGKKKAAALATT